MRFVSKAAWALACALTFSHGVPGHAETALHPQSSGDSEDVEPAADSRAEGKPVTAIEVRPPVKTARTLPHRLIANRGTASRRVNFAQVYRAPSNLNGTPLASRSVRSASTGGANLSTAPGTAGTGQPAPTGRQQVTLAAPVWNAVALPAFLSSAAAAGSGPGSAPVMPVIASDLPDGLGLVPPSLFGGGGGGKGGGGGGGSSGGSGGSSGGSGGLGSGGDDSPFGHSNSDPLLSNVRDLDTLTSTATGTGTGIGTGTATGTATGTGTRTGTGVTFNYNRVQREPQVSASDAETPGDYSHGRWGVQGYNIWSWNCHTAANSFVLTGLSNQSLASRRGIVVCNARAQTTPEHHSFNWEVRPGGRTCLYNWGLQC
jgi:hypothetical protein